MNQLPTSLALTAFKRRRKDNALITRLYNLSNEQSQHLDLSIPGKEGQICNLLEEDSGLIIPNQLRKGQILSTSWK